MMPGHFLRRPQRDKAAFPLPLLPLPLLTSDLGRGLHVMSAKAGGQPRDNCVEIFFVNASDTRFVVDVEDAADELGVA